MEYRLTKNNKQSKRWVKWWR